MYSRYFYKIEDAWTLPMVRVPRWFSGNAYPTIGDAIETPAITPFTSAGSFTTPGSSTIPASWAFVAHTPVVSGSIFQRVFEAFVAEKEYIWPGAISQALGRSFFFDEAEPEFAWVVAAPEDSVEKVEVLNSSGAREEIQKAVSYFDLFWSGDRRWWAEEGVVVIYGLAYQEQYTESRAGGSWQFVHYSSQWSSGGVLFWEHPVTKNWVPKHSLDVRSDGFINLYSPYPIRIRSHVIAAARQLSSLYVFVNDEKRLAELTNLWTTTDDAGLRENLYRKIGQPTSEFGQNLLLCEWFGRQTKRGLRSHISAALGQGTITTVSPSGTGFTFPANATGYSVRRMQRVVYRQEPIAYDVDTTNYYRSRFVAPLFGIAIFKGSIYTPVAVSGSVWSLDTHIENNRAELPMLFWGIEQWTEGASSVSFTEDMPQQEDIIVYFPENVQIVDPSNSVLRQSFKRVSPTYRWQRTTLVEVTAGLAVFN